MGKQHFAELPEYGLFLSFLINRKRNVFKRKPRKPVYKAFVHGKGNKRGLKLRYGMTERRRHFISVARRAGKRVGHTARCKNYAVCRQHLAALKQNACYGAVFGKYFFGGGVDYFRSAAPCGVYKRVYYIRRFIRDGENAVSALGFKRNAQRLEKRRNVFRSKARKGGI